MKRAGGISGGIDDDRIGDQFCVVTAGGDTQRLIFPATGRDTGQNHSLFGGILVNCDVIRLVQRRGVVHGRDGDAEGECYGAVVIRSGEIVIESAIRDDDSDHYNAVLISDRGERE